MGHRVLAVCLAGSLAGCFFGVEGNGRVVTERRRVPEVSQIESDGPFEVDISQGENFEVKVRVDSNLQRHVETHVSGDTLTIESDAWLLDLPAGPHVMITMPLLTRLENAGSGDVFAAWFEQDEALDLRVSGSGSVHFEGAVTDLRAEVTGSGDVQLSGTADFAELTIDGSGDINANDLVAAGADVAVSGSGDLRATVDGRVDARVDGSGDVDLSGDVERGRFSENGSGHIQVH